MPLARAKAKGLTFVDQKDFVVERAGRASWDALKASLDPAHRAILDEVVAVGWYDLEASQAVLTALPAAVGQPPGIAVRDFARFSAARHVGRFYRLLFLAVNPALMLEKCGEYWSRFFDSGTWKVTRESPTRARGDLVGFARPTPEHCEFLAHYITAIFERVGAKDPRTQHVRCRNRGDASCTFQIEWKG